MLVQFLVNNQEATYIVYSSHLSIKYNTPASELLENISGLIWVLFAINSSSKCVCIVYAWILDWLKYSIV